MHKSFAKMILNNEKICEILKNYDIITEVPIHKNRKSKRGYNQSILIVKEIAKNIANLRYEITLQKVKDNKKQSTLHKEERIRNVKDAYKIMKKEIICNKRIILFDDIYTTRCDGK